MTAARYAVYFAPAPDTALAALGRQWLGRDAEAGVHLPPPPCMNGAAGRWELVTASPRRYGFHATLKAPFVLSSGRMPEDLRQAVCRLAVQCRVFELPGLRVAEIGSFLALVLDAPSTALSALADRCVAQLDGLRAPHSEAELARRRAAGLSERQLRYLERWGYPYVFDEYRFHMTLTGSIEDPKERDKLHALLADVFEPACRVPVAIGDLCIFVQAAADAPFVVQERLPFGGPLA